MVDLSRLMQDAAILDVIDKSADEASSLSAQNSYQAMRIEDLERALAERDAEIAALRGHAEAMAVDVEAMQKLLYGRDETVMPHSLSEYRRDYPKEPK